MVTAELKLQPAKVLLYGWGILSHCQISSIFGVTEGLILK